jgi:transposase
MMIMRGVIGSIRQRDTKRRKGRGTRKRRGSLIIKRKRRRRRGERVHQLHLSQVMMELMMKELIMEVLSAYRMEVSYGRAGHKNCMIQITLILH